MSHDDKAEKKPASILRSRAVRIRTGLSQSKKYELMAKDQFPKPVRLSVRCVGWLEDEIDAWIRARIVERDTEPPKRRRRAREAAE